MKDIILSSIFMWIMFSDIDKFNSFLLADQKQIPMQAVLIHIYIYIYIYLIDLDASITLAWL